MWTLRWPPAKALMDLVDISRWSFLPRKTLQSETTEATYQRPENCKAAHWPTLPWDQGHRDPWPHRFVWNHSAGGFSVPISCSEPLFCHLPGQVARPQFPQP